MTQRDKLQKGGDPMSKQKKHKHNGSRQTQARTAGKQNKTDGSKKSAPPVDDKDRVLVGAVLGLIFGQFIWKSITAAVICALLSALLIFSVQRLVKYILRRQAVQRAGAQPDDPQKDLPAPDVQQKAQIEAPQAEDRQDGQSPRP